MLILKICLYLYYFKNIFVLIKNWIEVWYYLFKFYSLLLICEKDDFKNIFDKGYI